MRNVVEVQRPQAPRSPASPTPAPTPAPRGTAKYFRHFFSSRMRTAQRLAADRVVEQRTVRRAADRSLRLDPRADAHQASRAAGCTAGLCSATNVFSRIAGDRFTGLSPSTSSIRHCLAATLALRIGRVRHPAYAGWSPRRASATSCITQPRLQPRWGGRLEVAVRQGPSRPGRQGLEPLRETRKCCGNVLERDRIGDSKTGRSQGRARPCPSSRASASRCAFSDTSRGRRTPRRGAPVAAVPLRPARAPSLAFVSSGQRVGHAAAPCRRASRGTCSSFDQLFLRLVRPSTGPPARPILRCSFCQAERSSLWGPRSELKQQRRGEAEVA